MPDVSDQRLFELVTEEDRRLFDEGMELRRRDWGVTSAVIRRLGYVGYTLAGRGTPPEVRRIQTIYRDLYGRHALAGGGHMGVYMWRDAYYRIAFPYIYGTVQISFLDCVELQPAQKYLLRHEPDEMNKIVDQVCDAGDAQYGSREFKDAYRGNELAERFIDRAMTNLHGAAAILTGGYDPRGAIQSSLLAVELALKGGVAASTGLDEGAIRKCYGHRSDKLCEDITKHWPLFDDKRVAHVIAGNPDFVQSRYQQGQPPAREVGRIAMNAQYVVAEMIRQLSDRDLRSSLQPALLRTYPPLPE